MVRLNRKQFGHAVDSPKKRTNEFVLFAMKSKKANKTNLFVHFLGESTARQSAFGFIWPLSDWPILKLHWKCRQMFSAGVQSYRDCAHDDHTSFLIPWYKAIAVWCFDQHLLYGLPLSHRCQPIQNWVTFLQYFCNWALWRNFSSDFFSFPFFSFSRWFFREFSLIVYSLTLFFNFCW